MPNEDIKKEQPVLRAIIQTIITAIAFAGLAGSAWAGKDRLSKWEDQKPDASYTTTGNIYDMERCLIRAQGFGQRVFVYWQPDRPLERILLWESDAGSTARIDLISDGTKVKVTIWEAAQKNRQGVLKCFPDAPLR